MVDAASQHDHSNAIALHDALRRMQAAHNPPRQISGHLGYRVAVAAIGGEHDQVALVLLARMVAECGAKLPRV